MSRAIVAILALAIVAIGGVYGLEMALADVGTTNSVTNESWTPDAGNVTALNNSNLNGAYYHNDTAVYDENNTLQEEGTDYEWFETNGTVKALTGGGLDGDSDATISYSWEQTTAQQRTLAGLLGNIPAVVGLLFPAFVFVLLLILARG